jgi:drug/metabolite transporter (DMT)-like permease
MAAPRSHGCPALGLTLAHQRACFARRGRRDRTRKCLDVDRKLLGILCVVGAVSCFSTQDALIKWISGSYPLHEVVLARACLAAVLTLGLMRLEGGLRLLRSRRPLMHGARGLLLVTANSCFFLALAVMPLADATALFFVAPLLITTLSALFLGEPVGPRRWMAVLAGLVGVVVMVRPGADVVNLVALLPLGAAGAYAAMQIVTRRLGVTDRASTMAFYVQMTFIAVSAAMWLVAGDGRLARAGNPSLEFLLRAWVVPDRGDLGLLGAIGVLNAAGSYLVAQGYRISEPAVAAPFEYAAMPMAVTYGVVMWGDWPDTTAWVGITLIVSSGLYVLHREVIQRRHRPDAA